MSPSARPARRLPARVYWVRRGLVIGTGIALVVAFAQLFSGGGDGSADPEQATVVASKPTPTPTPTPTKVGPVPLTGTGPTAGATSQAPAVQANPNGPCDVKDVTVAPVAGTAAAGTIVPLTLQLSGISPACTFAVSARTVVAKVTRGGAKVWSTQDCPASVRPASVVVRSATPTTIQVYWNGRASDATCSHATDWAGPGSYQVDAAAIGSEPSQATVSLSAPPRPVVTRTIAPAKPKKTP